MARMNEAAAETPAAIIPAMSDRLHWTGPESDRPAQFLCAHLFARIPTVYAAAPRTVTLHPIGVVPSEHLRNSQISR